MCIRIVNICDLWYKSVSQRKTLLNLTYGAFDVCLGLGICVTLQCT